MIKLNSLFTGIATLAVVLISAPAPAKVSAEKAAELDGPKYTCIGAERAGSADGYPEYSGKFQGTWPGVKAPSASACSIVVG